MSPDRPETPTQEYDDDLIALLEALWGEGFMSPGGTAEVDRIVDGLDLTDRAVLDIGCGVGGAAIHLARAYRPATTIGIDVEEHLVRRCKELAARAGVAHLTDFRCVEPGPLPIENCSLHGVFSKDSIIHIADKLALAHDIYRALEPGGWFAASDWLAGYRGNPPPEMQAYIAAEGLDFALASVEVYTDAFAHSGFVDVRVRDRNAWYREEARRERDRLVGALYDDLLSTVGRAFLEHEIDVWSKMIGALDQGQLRPTHLRARKPE